MIEESLRWDESMWSARPPTPVNADVIRWHADSHHWTRQKAAAEPIFWHRGTKALKLAMGTAIRRTIMAALDRRPEGMTTMELAAVIGRPGNTNAVAAHLKKLRSQFLVFPEPRQKGAGKGGRRWRAVEKPAQD